MNNPDCRLNRKSGFIKLKNSPNPDSGLNLEIPQKIASPIGQELTYLYSTPFFFATTMLTYTTNFIGGYSN
jgi:hypothetical protein